MDLLHIGIQDVIDKNVSYDDRCEITVGHNGLLTHYTGCFFGWNV